MPSGPHSNVTASLSELERKLAELERELGAEPAAAAPPPATAPRPVPPPAPAPAPQPVAETAPPEPRVDELREEIADLVRIRDQLERAAAELVAEYDRLVGRLQEMQPATETPEDDGPVQPAPAAAPPAQPAGPPIPAGTAEDARALQGALVIDAGPFIDITTLTAFEQALAGVPDAREVYVRGFEASRALINIRLVRPVALVALLRERLPLSIAVREATVGRLVLDVTTPDTPDAGASG